MKQSLVYLLILIFSLPSFAGGFAIDSNMTQSTMMQTLEHKQKPLHDCHHASAVPAQDDSITSTHNCCEEPGHVELHTHSECEDNCGDCSHSCGGLGLALLTSVQRAIPPQSQLQLLASVRLPAAPYQNSLIPPII